MGAAAIGVTEKKDDEQGIDQQAIFYRMILFLAALTRGVVSLQRAGKYQRPAWWLS
jgi:hypothetical protein